MNETPSAAEELSWRKSSYSGGAGGECVEVADCVRAICVRDSKDTSRPAFSVATAAWTAFVSFAAQ
ncbi:DUF397 domain-containing protein [Streptomyces pluripotens]|uniref:DUF397 domain-containing protein n=1 Tax=Streptomyces pluripotens TaxID=1355015 RepID=A0A221P496_9ACTN|nr:DUF397 domain-containing protein [Streptomyces pluripotens]ARP72781.1 DUF397 domain-containing protein [Streptomyces pluripotens]ASN27030.1 DUF397 domain-containing protein [Streptomyces pluripotens]